MFLKYNTVLASLHLLQECIGVFKGSYSNSPPSIFQITCEKEVCLE